MTALDVADRARAIVGPDWVITDDAQLRVYECDGLTNHRTVPGAVILPGSTQEVAAIVLDLHMPGISGQELLQRITYEYPQVPVVIMTGERRLDRVVEAMSAGATTYMMKPFTQSQLVMRAKELIQPRESGSFHY